MITEELKHKVKLYFGKLRTKLASIIAWFWGRNRVVGMRILLEPKDEGYVTVKELREVLRGVPDDSVVKITCGRGSSIFNYFAEGGYTLPVLGVVNCNEAVLLTSSAELMTKDKYGDIIRSAYLEADRIVNEEVVRKLREREKYEARKYNKDMM